MSAISRRERKYVLTRDEYLRVSNALAPFLKRDPYSVRAGGSYLVRSLYFDTRDYRAWYEKEDGDFGRIKLRLRSYTCDPEQCDRVSVEIKTKNGDFMRKYGTPVSPDEYRNYIRNRWWNDPSDPVLCEFERLMRVRSLVPVCIVQYRREGFAARDDASLRITLDHGVSSTRANELFPESEILKPHRPKNIILEIKTRSSEPMWLQEVIRSQRLALWSNSKYWQGIEVIRPNMVTPREVAP